MQCGCGPFVLFYFYMRGRFFAARKAPFYTGAVASAGGNALLAAAAAHEGGIHAGVSGFAWKVWGLGFGVCVLGFEVWGLRFSV
jgi:hypothetical protein